MEKTAEHGGANPQGRDVALFVAGEPIEHHAVANDGVETTQIAPTILRCSVWIRPSCKRCRSNARKRCR